MYSIYPMRVPHRDACGLHSLTFTNIQCMDWCFDTLHTQAYDYNNIFFIPRFKTTLMISLITPIIKAIKSKITFFKEREKRRAFWFISQ